MWEMSNFGTHNLLFKCFSHFFCVLKYSSLDQAMFPEKEPFGRMFNPLDVPILDTE